MPGRIYTGCLALPSSRSGLPLEAVRVVMFVAGALTVVMYLAIAREIGVESTASTTGALLLTVTPQFLLFSRIDLFLNR